MFGGIDPKKIQGMMSKMGIKQEEIDAIRVVIEQEDKNIVIENPAVVKINMQGQESFQISGSVKEEGKITKDDIKAVMEKTRATEKESKEALEKTGGDLAEAILSLS